MQQVKIDVWIRVIYTIYVIIVELMCLTHALTSPVLEKIVARMLWFKKKTLGEIVAFSHGRIWEDSKCVGDHICLIRYTKNTYTNLGKVMRGEDDQIGKKIFIRTYFGEIMRYEKIKPFGETRERIHILFVEYIWIVLYLFLGLLMGILKNMVILTLVVVSINFLLSPVLLLLRNKSW